jgi:hypothetical protein
MGAIVHQFGWGDPPNMLVVGFAGVMAGMSLTNVADEIQQRVGGRDGKANGR